MRRTIDDLRLPFRSACDRKSGRSGRYRPFVDVWTILIVDVRTILTGVSSRISTTSLLPDEAAAWARVVRDKDDNFGSRSPPNINWLYILYLHFGFRAPSHVQPCFTGFGGGGFCFSQDRDGENDQLMRGSPRVQQSRSIGNPLRANSSSNWG